MVLQNLSQMARKVEESWRAAWASLGALPDEPRTLVDDTPGFLRVHTPGVPESLLNLVMGYAAPGPATRAAIEGAIAPFREHGLPFQWWLLLGTEPAGLRDTLRALGMQTWGGATAMALPLAEPERPYPPPARGVEIAPVATPDEAAAALGVIADVFYIPAGPMRRWCVDNPAFRVYVARWEGEVVAALATMIAGETVGVYHVATRQGARRRGIAGNLAIRALRDARGAGASWATLTATPEARHLYEQLGFRSCGVIEQWMPGYRLTRELTGGAGDAFDPWG